MDGVTLHTVTLPSWHWMSKFGSVRMKNLQPVIASVGDSLHSNLPLEIKNVPARYHCDLTVGELGQHLQSFLRLGRDDGQRWLLSEVRKGAVKVEDDAKLGAVIHQSSKVLLKIFNVQLIDILLRVMTFILMVIIF